MKFCLLLSLPALLYIVMQVHSSAVTAAANRGCCRTVESLKPICCHVVVSLASHWHISFSSLFSRQSSTLSITRHPCISLPPHPCLLLWDLNWLHPGVVCVCGCGCVCLCWSSSGKAIEGTERSNRDSRRCAVVGYKASGRLGGQALCGCVPVGREDCFYPEHLS